VTDQTPSSGLARLAAYLLFAIAPAGFGGECGVAFIYQPITTFGTDADPHIYVTKIPIVVSGAPESCLSYLSEPNKLLQHQQTPVEDSNMLSQVGISIETEEVPKALNSPNYFVVTLNLSRMAHRRSPELTEEAAVKIAVTCIRRTIEENHRSFSWKTWRLRIVPRSEDGDRWAKYETAYPVKRGN
jgi:hypothetical protein